MMSQGHSKAKITLALLITIFFLLTALLCAQPTIRFKRKKRVAYIGSTKILLARGYRPRTIAKKSFRTKDYILDLYAKDFAQGNLMYMEIMPRHKNRKNLEDTKAKAPRLLYNGRPVPIAATSWGHRAFIPIAPWAKMGKHKFMVQSYGSSKNKQIEHNLHIRKTKFPISKSKIYIQGSRKTAGKRLSRAKRLAIKRYAIKKRKAFRHYSQDIFVGPLLAHPRDYHFITSEFWAKRYVARFKRKRGQVIQIRPYQRTHQGLDLRGRWGEPVYAIAAGQVILSERMHYEGNFVLINHGQGMFSGYMHLQDRYIHEGDFIEPGQQIGTAGATGRVTAAHLHILLYVRKVPVHPLSLLSLPVRD